jgi:hypothetical protein
MISVNTSNDDMEWYFTPNLIGWIHRRVYADKAAALHDAVRAAGVRNDLCFYIVEMDVPDIARQYWPHPTHWNIRTEKPFQPVTDKETIDVGKEFNLGISELVTILVCEYNPIPVILQPGMF